MRARGELRSLHRGVYVSGPIEPELARFMAAVTSCGPNAYLSHDSAAYRWRYLPVDLSGDIAVTVVGRNPGSRDGIRIHRTLDLPGDETTSLDAIPMTSPARTILDLAATSTGRRLEQAVAEAIARRRVSTRALQALTERHPRHRGSRPLAALLELDRDPARVRSTAEEDLLALVREAGLPDPLVNAQFHGFEIDFLWLRERLAVEVDGLAYHSSGSSIKRDREKEAVLARYGFELIRLLPGPDRSRVPRVRGAYCRPACRDPQVASAPWRAGSSRCTMRSPCAPPTRGRSTSARCRRWS